MSAANLSYLHPNGRIRGCYVYMLMLAIDEQNVLVKVGMTARPLERLHDLLLACPVRPELYCTVELPNRRLARKVEVALHAEMAQWRGNGEWFEVPLSEKPAFNDAWRSVFLAFAKPSWSLKWSKHSVAAIVEAGRERMRAVRGMYRRRGAAYQDFLHHSESV